MSLSAIIGEFINLYKNHKGLNISDKIIREDPRKTLNYLLTTVNFDLPESLIRNIEKLILSERLEKISISSIPMLSLEKLSIWKGDITTLEIEAIVNAANSQMLGCFTPQHPCIDNIIHLKAGPRLRMECRKLMDEQGTLEPVGKAKLTLGYCLPAKYIIHTVGPQFEQNNIDQVQQLSNCYISCLELALKHNIKTLAFCCISTGIYGFPADQACQIALLTVKNWLLNPGNYNAIDRIVFNVFTPKDLQLYQQYSAEDETICRETK